MAKIYVFGIGGTGSRVMRSLTMLLAAGVDMNGYDIVPIIIDPDSSNSDLTRCVQLLNRYEDLHKSLNFSEGNENRFFKTKILRTMPSFKLLIKDTDDKSFRQFISYANMSKENQAMAQMLFSEANLESDMNVGFKGNPNIGSVVLNQIETSENFEEFANTFADGDKIFIISSIFGGTGASGFPLLLKTLRHNKSIPNHAIINSAEIGALTMLPYFKVRQDADSSIDSATFISKAKSALKYYESNITKNQELNAFYFLGDNDTNTYDNHEGGTDQKNAAHLLELMAATAIVDFAGHQHEGECTNKELSINYDSGSVTMNCFFSDIARMLRRPLTQFILMANCFDEKMDFISSNKLAANSRLFKDTSSFYKSQFVIQLHKFLKAFKEWLGEMHDNHLPLSLFKLNTGSKPFDLVTDVKASRIMDINSDYDLFFSKMNGVKITSTSENDKLLEMFYLATRKLVELKYKF